MTSSFLRRARAAWLFGTGLVVAGLFLLLYFVALLFWEFGASQSEVLGATLQFVDRSLLRPGIVEPVLGLLQGLPPAWLTSLNIAIVSAVLGVGLAALGALIARWQMAVLELEKRRREDRLRRVQLYRDSSRLEPFIGPGAQVEQHDAQERRVA